MLLRLPTLYTVAAIALMAGACARPQPADLAVGGVTVVDVTDGSLRANQTVLIEGDRIVAVGPANKVRASAGAELVEAAGKYLIPGLWDMHALLFNHGDRAGTDRSAWALPLFVTNGVTGVRDMWTDAEDISKARAWNEARDRGDLPAPYIEWTSTILDGAQPVHPGARSISTEEEARRTVQELKAGDGRADLD